MRPSLTAFSRRTRLALVTTPRNDALHRHAFSHMGARQHHLVRSAQPSVEQAPSSTGDESLGVRGARTQNSQLGADFFTEKDSRPVILFDGVCNMCNGGVNFVLDWDKEGVYRFAALQSDAGKALLQRSGRAPDDISSICLVTKDSHWIKSQAVIKIAERLAMPLPLLRAVRGVTTDDFRNDVYDFIAINRYAAFGQSASCRLMQPEWKDRFLV